MACDDDRDEGIAGDGRIAKRIDGYERIVFGCEDQCRHSNPIDDPHRAGPIVVVAGIAESMMRRGEGFVELPDRPHAAQFLQREFMWKDGGFPPHPRLEPAHEVELVGDVRSALQCFHARGEVHRR